MAAARARLGGRELSAAERSEFFLD
jgi:hypothetical protein